MDAGNELDDKGSLQSGVNHHISGSIVGDSSSSSTTEVVQEGSDMEGDISDDKEAVEDVCIEVHMEPCPLCGQDPCDWISFGDEICEECDEMMNQKQPTKEIRFHAYKMYTRLRFGVL